MRMNRLDLQTPRCVERAWQTPKQSEPERDDGARAGRHVACDGPQALGAPGTEGAENGRRKVVSRIHKATASEATITQRGSPDECFGFLEKGIANHRKTRGLEPQPAHAPASTRATKSAECFGELSAHMVHVLGKKRWFGAFRSDRVMVCSFGRPTTFPGVLYRPPGLHSALCSAGLSPTRLAHWPQWTVPRQREHLPVHGAVAQLQRHRSSQDQRLPDADA